MHTKKEAKKRNLNLTGDRIDSCMRAMNYAQTNGIPVGNAVSRVISEIILCIIDNEIQEKFPDITCCRYVDDYYIFLKDSIKVQDIISFIRNALGQYELTLNENKIEINESPFIYTNKWIEEIRLFVHLDSELFLNKAVSLYLEYKDVKILRYALTVLSYHDLTEKQWSVMESKIINIWAKFPSLSDKIITILKNRSRIQKYYLKKAIYSIFDRCIPLNMHQEVIWAVWFVKIFDIKIKSEYVSKIIESNNSLAIIILLDIIKSSYSKSYKPILSKLKEILEDEDYNGVGNQGNLMWSENWLLAYEADLNQWLNDGNQKFEFARNHPFFKNLIKMKIEFYDPKYQYQKSKIKENAQYLTKHEFTNYMNQITKLLNESGNKNIKVSKMKAISDKLCNKFAYLSEEY